MLAVVRIALVVAAVLALSGCGSEDEVADDESVAAALQEWVAADTGAFEHVTHYTASDDGPKQVIEGEYELSTGQATFSQEVSGIGEEAALLEYVVAEGVVFMTAPKWPAAIRGCWLVVDDAALAQTGLDASSKDRLPANLQSLQTLVETNGTATVELLSAAQIFLGARFLSTLDLADLEGRVPVEVELEDGRIRSWQLSGKHVAEALQATGTGLGAEAVRGLRPMVSKVEYSDVGKPVEVTPPPERVRMTGEEMEAEKCDAR